MVRHPAAIARIRVPAAPARGRNRDNKPITASMLMNSSGSERSYATSPASCSKSCVTYLQSSGSGSAESITRKGPCSPRGNEAKDCGDDKRRIMSKIVGLGGGEPIGSRSARGLEAGPSIMRKGPRTSQEGSVQKLRFASQAEWAYDPPSYGELGCKSTGPLRSHKLPQTFIWHTDRRRRREENQHLDTAARITSAFALGRLHGHLEVHGWPVAWTIVHGNSMCCMFHPPPRWKSRPTLHLHGGLR